MAPKRPKPDDDDPTDEEVREGRGTTFADRATHRYGRAPPKSSKRKGGGATPRRAGSGATKETRRKPQPSPIALRFNGSSLTVTRGKPNALANHAPPSGLPAGAPHP